MSQHFAEGGACTVEGDAGGGNRGAETASGTLGSGMKVIPSDVGAAEEADVASGVSGDPIQKEVFGVQADEDGRPIDIGESLVITAGSTRCLETTELESMLAIGGLPDATAVGAAALRPQAAEETASATATDAAATLPWRWA